MSVILSNEEIKEKYLEYTKLYQRIKKNGDHNIVKKVGRKSLSTSHKKATYEKWLTIRKEKRIEQALLEGRTPGRGRPKKNKIN